jgi:anti-anti-sigma factor
MREPHTDPPIIRFACLSEVAPEATLIHVAGDVDLRAVPTLWSNLNAMREDNLNVVVDLHAVEYIDSSGLRR